MWAISYKIEMNLQSHIRLIFLSAFVLFVLNKWLIRPWITKMEIQGFVVLFSYSVPNFIEAIMGSFIVTGFLAYYGKTWFRSPGLLQITGVSLAGIYG